MQHEGAATTATIAAYNFVCAQTKAATTGLNAAQTRVESRRVAATICPITYKLKMWNVLQFGASTAMCNARLQHKTRKRELTKNKKNKTETQLQLHTKRDQRTTGRMKHIFFGVFDASLHQFMQICCRQTSWYKTFIYYYVKKFTIKGLKRRPKRLSMNFENMYIRVYIFSRCQLLLVPLLSADTEPVLLYLHIKYLL